jgi:hypothetical protein
MLSTSRSEAVLGEDQSEIIITLLRKVGQFLANRSRDVLEVRIAQSERLHIRSHDICDATDLGGSPKLIHSRFFQAVAFLESFHRYIHPNFVPKLETIGNCLGWSVYLETSASNRIFLHSGMKSFSRHTHKSNGRRSYSGGPCLDSDGHPDFMRGLGRELMKSKGREETNDAVRNLVRRFYEGKVLGDGRGL